MPNNKVDLTGRRFGRLIVRERADDHISPRGGRSHMWVCDCDCGNTKIMYGSSLLRGSTRSCGCLSVERQPFRNRIHGMSHSRLERIYNGMYNRCYNTKHDNYKNYGMRGITICDEWLSDHSKFYNWAMANGYNDLLSLDRIDNNLGYSPDNCRFVSMIHQENHRRNNVYYELDGERHTLSEWGRITGISYNTLRARIVDLHWPVERALNTPLQR